MFISCLSAVYSLFRMTRVSGINLYNDVEIYKYRPGGFIQPHSDYLFSSSPYGKNVAQGLLFFSSTLLGGNYIMPLLGIAVNPDPGKLVVWRNWDRSGNFDPRSVQLRSHPSIHIYKALFQFSVPPSLGS